MKTLTTQDAEILRHAVLAALVLRHPAAMTQRAIRAAIARDVPFQFEDAALESALEMFRDMQLVKFQHDGFGATKYWTVTADGVLYLERNK